MINRNQKFILSKKVAAYLLLLFTSFVVFSGCKKDDETPEVINMLGLGDSNETPTGIAFSLPTNIILPKEIQAYNEDCYNDETPMGSGIGYVDLCISLYNSSSAYVSVNFPAGLIFISDDLSTQNGYLAKNEVIEVPGNSTISKKIRLYCLNEARAGAYGDVIFKLGPITTNKNLVELQKMLEGKNFSNFDYFEEGIIQDAVWNITERGGLTPEDRKAISEL